MRSKNYLGAYLRRKRGRLGAAKAITAALELARILYQLERFGEAYAKQTEEQYVEQDRERQEKNLARRAAQMGYTLTKIEQTPAQEQTPRG